jgi:hypothetical protein
MGLSVVRHYLAIEMRHTQVATKHIASTEMYPFHPQKITILLNDQDLQGSRAPAIQESTGQDYLG